MVIIAGDMNINRRYFVFQHSRNKHGILAISENATPLKQSYMWVYVYTQASNCICIACLRMINSWDFICDVPEVYLRGRQSILKIRKINRVVSLD